MQKLANWVNSLFETEIERGLINLDGTLSDKGREMVFDDQGEYLDTHQLGANTGIEALYKEIRYMQANGEIDSDT